MEAFDFGQVGTALIVLAVLAVLATLRSPQMGGRGTLLLRSLFPTWRFFEEVTELPLLEYRIKLGAQDFQPWIPCPRPPTRRWYNLLLNPAGNMAMAYNSLLQLFEDELEAQSEGTRSSNDRIGRDTEWVSYNLLVALVRSEIYERAKRDGFAIEGVFEFRLSRLMQGSGPESAEPIFYSATLQVCDG